MRLPAFLFASCGMAVLAFSTSFAPQQSSVSPPNQSRVAPEDNYNPSRMWRRAEIRVTPLEQVDLNRTKLESLRQRVAAAETESAGFWFSDPTLRKQLLSQQQLIKDLLDFAEQQQDNRHKSPTAIQVERRLNQIQGQIMCEACHSGIVAQNKELTK